MPNDAQDFSFTDNIVGPNSFLLDDDGDTTLSNTKTFLNVVPGSYSVTEAALTGWVLTSLTCSDGNSTGNTGTGVASIVLDPGETVTCTYVNKQALLSVDKPAPSLDDVDGSGDVSVGDILTYTVTATNDGTSNLTNVVVTDGLTGFVATGGTTPCASVAPGGTCTLIGTYVVTAADVAAGSIDNTGTADSDQTGPVTDPETGCPNPLLSVDKPAPSLGEDGSGDVSVGDILTYTVTATIDRHFESDECGCD